MKLYKVLLRGMQHNPGTYSVTWGVAYAVANNTDEAYKLVRDSLASRDIGLDSDRELESVELLAEDFMYPHCGHILYIQNNEKEAE